MKRFHEMAAIPTVQKTIGKGDTGIKNTVAEMKHQIDIGSKHPFVRRWAQEILGGVLVNDKRAEANAVFAFVRDNVRYTRDPKGYEYLQTPLALLEDVGIYKKGEGERPIGDCDDMVTLGLSLLKSIGFETAMKVTSYRPDKKFSHVYGLVNIEGDWTPFDTVRPTGYLGMEAPSPTRIMEVKI